MLFEGIFTSKFNLITNCCVRRILSASLSTLKLADDSQRSYILEVVNSASEEQLCQYKLTKKCSEALLKYRTANGHIPDLDSLLGIEGFSRTQVAKMCRSILGDNGDAKRKTKLVTVPVLTKDDCRDIQEMVSVDVKFPNLSFAHLLRDRDLQSWQTVPILTESKKLDLHDLHKMAVFIVNVLPQADVYLLEQNTTLKKKDLAVLSLKLLEAIVFAMLKTNGSNVVTVSESSLCRHFKLNVGNERVGSQKLVEGLIRPQNDSHTNLHVGDVLLESYDQLDTVQRECLSNALLLAVAFNELIIHGS